MSKLICPQCNGLKWLVCHYCTFCDNNGLITDTQKHNLWRGRGMIIRKWRLEQKLTLRQVQEKYGVDPGNLSKMEQGKLNPARYW